MVGTLAVGLAANGIIFNFLDALVLRAFDFPNAGAARPRVRRRTRDLGGIDRETSRPPTFSTGRRRGAAAWPR